MNVNLNVNPLESWVKTKSKPLVIAGPCSAETPEQLLATAKGLKALGKVGEVTESNLVSNLRNVVGALSEKKRRSIQAHIPDYFHW